MLHNSLSLFQNVCDMSNKEIAKIFESWNKRELSSYLIEITATILAKDDEITGKGQVVDYVLDKTGTKGTGKWTIQEAAEKSVAAPTMAASLEMRYMSGRKDERVMASKMLAAPFLNDVNKEQVVQDLRAALYCSKICSYAQGLSLIRAASDEHGWSLDLSECARLWTGGCIIRAKLLGPIQEAFSANPNLASLLVDPGFAADLNMHSRGWRRAVALAITSGVTCPALASSLTYFDQYRRERLPANLTQAQRDFFGE
jgi:6-phosphogluconate dehydrogenase